MKWGRSDADTEFPGQAAAGDKGPHHQTGPLKRVSAPQGPYRVSDRKALPQALLQMQDVEMSLGLHAQGQPGPSVPIQTAGRDTYSQGLENDPLWLWAGLELVGTMAHQGVYQKWEVWG
jgi:hypothetical protein